MLKYPIIPLKSFYIMSFITVQTVKMMPLLAGTLELAIIYVIYLIQCVRC